MPLDLFATAASLSDCVCEALKAAEHPSERSWEGTCCVWPGASVAFDSCCEGESQAWVTVLSGVATSRFPVADPGPITCNSGRTQSVQFEIGSLRCVSTCEGTSEEACTCKETDAQDILIDLQAMLQGVTCCLTDDDANDGCGLNWSLNSWRLIGPEGGCSGSVINISIEQDLPCCPEPAPEPEPT